MKGNVLHLALAAGTARTVTGLALAQVAYIGNEFVFGVRLKFRFGH